MSARILILGEAERVHDDERASDMVFVADREAASVRLAEPGLEAVCLDRRELGDALADARWLRKRRCRLPVIALVEAYQVGHAATLFRNGIAEIVVRDHDSDQMLRVRAALYTDRRGRVADPAPIPGLVARSAAMKACIELVKKARSSEATALIQGETGTGKEVIARAVHAGGMRADRAFVAINCAAFPETLLESELFGYERGAFTGANRPKAGHFVAADGGTLFLDEIAETSLAFQVKLLRALQEGVVRPLGANAERRVDVRIIAATNRDLFHEVEAGRFRRDLYYRLHVLPVHLPPLRSRVEDILPLAQHFLAQHERGPASIARDAAHLLETYPWPGNVRELENEIARVVANADAEEQLSARMLSPAIQGLAPALPPDLASETLRQTMARLERWVLHRALERHQGRRIATARSLGITRECLYKKLKRYGMQ